MKNRIVLLGPPATGKGTQAALLAAAFGIPTASTGALFRKAKADDTPLGHEADRWTSQGRLVPDELAMQVVWNWIDGHDRFILDGFPRTVGQAEAFDQGLKERQQPLDVVYFLTLSDEAIRDRMTSRLTCPACGSVFNQKFHHVDAGAPCPQCGAPLARRKDDNLEALDQRLAQYRELTLPVATYYRNSGVLREIDASPSRDELFHQLYDDVREGSL